MKQVGGGGGAAGAYTHPDPILLLAGSAANPTYAFSTDPNTGMYSGGADILAFATAGVEVLNIDAAGLATFAGAVTVTGTTILAATTLGGVATFSSSANFAGVLTAPVGTAALPAYSFVTDPNTGMYRAGVDILAFSTAGAEALRIDAVGLATFAGDVTITGDLTVSGTTTQLDTLVNVTEQWTVTNAGTGPAVVINQTGVNDILDVQDDGTSILFIEDGGNIGIGLTDPTSLLHLSGSSPDITFTDTDGGDVFVAGNDGGVFRIRNTTDARTDITVDGAGNAGIGVTPEAWSSTYRSLQVGGTGSLMCDATSGSGKSLSIAQNAYFDGLWKYQNTDEASYCYQAGGTHVFQVAASGTEDTVISWTTAMTVANNASVGIGAAPAASSLLDVTSTTKGFLPPRMTTTQKNAISSPATSLVVFDTTIGTLQEYSGSVWRTPGSVAFRATTSSGQSINASSATKVSFNTESWDTNSDYDPTTNFRFTPTVAGTYSINAQVSFSSLDVGSTAVVYIRKNGTTVAVKGSGAAISGKSVEAEVSDDVQFNGSSDYVEVFVLQDSAAAKTLSTSTSANKFSGHRVSN